MALIVVVVVVVVVVIVVIIVVLIFTTYPVPTAFAKVISTYEDCDHFPISLEVDCGICLQPVDQIFRLVRQISATQQSNYMSNRSIVTCRYSDNGRNITFHYVTELGKEISFIANVLATCRHFSCCKWHMEPENTGKAFAKTQVTGNILTCPKSLSNLGRGKEQRDVIGQAKASSMSSEAYQLTYMLNTMSYVMECKYNYYPQTLNE